MANNYFTKPTNVSRHTLARADDINKVANATDQAFDKLPDRVKLAQGRVNFGVESGSGNAYIVTIGETIEAYADGLAARFRITHTNSGAATLNVNSLGAVPIVTPAGAAMVAHQLLVGSVVEMVYVAGSFQLMTSGGALDAHSHAIADVVGLAATLASHTSSIAIISASLGIPDVPTLADVAISGAYGDLSGTPTLGVLAAGDDATDVPFTPAGDLTSTNVNDALVEIAGLTVAPDVISAEEMADPQATTDLRSITPKTLDDWIQGLAPRTSLERHETSVTTGSYTLLATDVAIRVDDDGVIHETRIFIQHGTPANTVTINVPISSSITAAKTYFRFVVGDAQVGTVTIHPVSGAQINGDTADIALTGAGANAVLEVLSNAGSAPICRLFGDLVGPRTIKGLVTYDTLPVFPAGGPLNTGALEFIIDGGGSTITTGIKGDLLVPVACTITSATLLADQSGAIVIDVWKDTYANFPPTDADSITASAPPTITASGTKSQDSTLTGWTKPIAAGSILRFNVDSVTNHQRVTLALGVTF